MREFIGHKIVVALSNQDKTGILVDERKELILLKTDEGVHRILKDKIVSFIPVDFEPKDYVPFHMLYCENKDIKCVGVAYIKEGEGFSQSSFDLFMKPCPKKCATCKCGTKGELRSVSGEFLKKTIAGTLYGDYPDEGGKVEKTAEEELEEIVREGEADGKENGT